MVEPPWPDRGEEQEERPEPMTSRDSSERRDRSLIFLPDVCEMKTAVQTQCVDGAAQRSAPDMSAAPVHAVYSPTATDEPVNHHHQGP